MRVRVQRVDQITRDPTSRLLYEWYDSYYLSVNTVAELARFELSLTVIASTKLGLRKSESGEPDVSGVARVS